MCVGIRGMCKRKSGQRSNLSAGVKSHPADEWVAIPISANVSKLQKKEEASFHL